MSRNGLYVGGASIMLVFAILCLTVFALITLSAANYNSALASVDARMVTNYYEADTLAECIVGELLSGTDSDYILGTSVESEWDWDLLAEVSTFSCEISDSKELYVKVAVYEDSYDILNWRMRDTVEWEIDESLPIWTGE